jgi:mannose-6-phosphate isomerase-like protein (cupin superfamily)
MNVRRVVAGVDDNGKSVFLSDGPAPCTLDYQYMPGQAHTRIWRTDGTVTTKPPAEEPTTDTGPMLPTPGGASFLILQVAPNSFVTDPRFDPAKSGEEFATYCPDMAAVMEPDNPGMHRTDTVDYVIVLDGEVTLELGDGGQTRLMAGDTLVQLGSRHAWRNETERPATLAVVLTGTPG